MEIFEIIFFIALILLGLFLIFMPKKGARLIAMTPHSRTQDYLVTRNKDDKWKKEYSRLQNKFGPIASIVVGIGMLLLALFILFLI